MPNSSGYLIIRASAAEQALPVAGALVEISTSGASSSLLATSQTDRSGQSERFILPAPPLQYSDSPDGPSAFRTYIVRVSHPQYDSLQVEGVSVFPGITSILPVQLSPIVPGTAQKTSTLDITTEIGGSGGANG